MKHVFVFLIRIYQWTLAPMIGQACRFYPSCSHYGVEALQKHGALKGSWLTLKRVCRCHPWNPKNLGGIDPVP
jgi:hypothetical protein